MHVGHRENRCHPRQFYASCSLHLILEHRVSSDFNLNAFYLDVFKQDDFFQSFQDDFKFVPLAQPRVKVSLYYMTAK